MVRRFVRFGVAAEKSTLVEAAADIDGVVLPGHLVGDQVESLRTWATDLAAAGIPYFVDPESYAYFEALDGLLNARGDEPRRSWRKTAARLLGGTKLEERVLAGHRLRVEDINGTSQLSADGNQLVENTRRLQLEFGQADEEVAKYVEFAAELGLELPTVPGHCPPDRLVAPYIFVDSTVGPRADLQRRLNESFLHATAADALPRWGVLALSNRGLFDEDLGEWAADSLVGYDGVFLWVDGLNEHQATSMALRQLRRVVDQCAQAGLAVGSLYGSGFSACLGPTGLQVRCFGPCYGDSRPREAPATKGPRVLQPRYFMPHSLSKLSRADYSTWLTETELRCACSHCEGMDDDGLFEVYFGPDGQHPARAADFHRLRRHFLEADAQLSASLAEESTDAVVDRLTAIRDSLTEEYAVFASVKAGHLDRWLAALSDD